MSDLTISPPSAGGGGMSIGGAVTSGTDNCVLFIDPAGILSQDTAFTYESLMNTLTITDGDLQVIGSTAGMGQATFQTVASINNPIYSYVNDVAVTNLITNPSFEVNTTGWTAVAGATITRSTGEKRQGDASLRIQITTTANAGGSVDITVGTGAYTISWWGKSTAASETINIVYSGVRSGSTSHSVTSSGWSRSYLNTSTGSAGTVTFRWGTAGSAESKDFYIDCIQAEAVNIATTPSCYCDGSMGQGHAWTGTAHASTSTRAAGHHFLGSTTVSPARGFSVLSDGSLCGGYRSYNVSDSSSLIAGGLWEFTGSLPTINATASLDSSLLGIIKATNSGNGSGLIVSSATTTDIGMVLSTQSITSGTAFSIAISSDKTNFTGEYFKFTAKAATDTGDWRWSKTRHQIGTMNENLNKSINWYGGGVWSKSNTAQATTITQAAFTVTASAAAFAASDIGKIIVPATGSEVIITAFTSTTVVTVNTSQTVAAGTAWSFATAQYSPPIIFHESSDTDHRSAKHTGKVQALFFDEFGNLQQHNTSLTAGASTITVASTNSGAFSIAAADTNITAGSYIHVNGMAPLQVLSYTSGAPGSGTFRGQPSATVPAGTAYRIRKGDFNYPTSATDTLNRPLNVCDYKLTSDLTYSSASGTEKSIFTNAAPSTTAAALPIMPGGKWLVDRCYRIHLWGTITGGATKALLTKVYLGSTQIVGNTTATTMGSASTMNFFMDILIANQNSTAVQRTALKLQAATDAAAPTVNHIIARGTSTVPTSADQPLDITFRFNTAAGAATIEGIVGYWE